MKNSTHTQHFKCYGAIIIITIVIIIIIILVFIARGNYKVIFTMRLSGLVVYWLINVPTQ